MMLARGLGCVRFSLASVCQGWSVVCSRSAASLSSAIGDQEVASPRKRRGQSLLMMLEDEAAPSTAGQSPPLTPALATASPAAAESAATSKPAASARAVDGFHLFLQSRDGGSLQPSAHATKENLQSWRQLSRAEQNEYNQMAMTTVLRTKRSAGGRRGSTGYSLFCRDFATDLKAARLLSGTWRTATGGKIGDHARLAAGNWVVLSQAEQLEYRITAAVQNEAKRPLQVDH